MRIRKQLNTAYLGGSVVLAAVFGLMTESWWMFAIVLVAMLAVHLYQGDVRQN